jgi:hypothetical protein
MGTRVCQEAHAEASLEMSPRGDRIYAQRLKIGGGPAARWCGIYFCYQASDECRSRLRRLKRPTPFAGPVPGSHRLVRRSKKDNMPPEGHPGRATWPAKYAGRVDSDVRDAVECHVLSTEGSVEDVVVGPERVHLQCLQGCPPQRDRKSNTSIREMWTGLGQTEKGSLRAEYFRSSLTPDTGPCDRYGSFVPESDIYRFKSHTVQRWRSQ